MKPIIAVYIKRTDGDYDFAAAFPNDETADVRECPAEKYAENLKAEGETVLVRKFADLAHLVDVLTR
jgi:hypothetical protein